MLVLIVHHQWGLISVEDVECNGGAATELDTLGRFSDCGQPAIKFIMRPLSAGQAGNIAINNSAWILLPNLFSTEALLHYYTSHRYINEPWLVGFLENILHFCVSLKHCGTSHLVVWFKKKKKTGGKGVQWQNQNATGKYRYSPSSGNLVGRRGTPFTLHLSQAAQLPGTKSPDDHFTLQTRFFMHRERIPTFSSLWFIQNILPIPYIWLSLTEKTYSFTFWGDYSVFVPFTIIFLTGLYLQNIKKKFNDGILMTFKCTNLHHVWFCGFWKLLWLIMPRPSNNPHTLLKKIKKINTF